MRKKITIEGMSCSHCVKHVSEALSELEGVSGVEVNLEEKYAKVDFNPDIKVEMIISALDEAGYEATEIIALEES